MTQPIDEIIKWSDQKLQPWQRDALRRLACGGALTGEDQGELLAMVKQKAGLKVAIAPPEPVSLAKSHFSGAASGVPLKLLAVRNVQNVNRLATGARVDFAEAGLTIVYGRNGSGKSGFVRILRTACRTRIDNPVKLKVLSNVYGSGSAPQTAEIVIDTGSGAVAIPWSAGGVASNELLQVAVFDSAAAALYVDQGHQIRFLPFGLALPHKLNELCLALKALLEAERSGVTQKLGLALVRFSVLRATEAQGFYSALTDKIGDEAIDAACNFTAADADRLAAIQEKLAADPGSSADLRTLATWAAKLGQDCASITATIGDEAMAQLVNLAQDARDKRQAAGLDAKALFKDEPLPDVGAGAWRALWTAARDYSLEVAYPGEEFPVVTTGGMPASCVLCQQPLGADAAARMQRFKTFMEGALAAAADEAEVAVAVARAKLPSLAAMEGGDWAGRMHQLAVRDMNLAHAVTAFGKAASERLAYAQGLLAGLLPTEGAAALRCPADELNVLAAKLKLEAEERAKAGEDAVRAQLLTEMAELEDRKVLADNVSQLRARRDLLRDDAAYQIALKDVNTKPITEAANRFVDDHLTTKVVEQFECERTILDIQHLKIGLARKSDKTKAAFGTDPGTAITKSASDILSEGEQRALALSAFLTEVTMTDGSGPIVIDDPVSSLDRERSVKVAVRLAAEAKRRQVVVFTHDLVFFNDLFRESENIGVAPMAVALFANKLEAGKVDPSGVTWKGLPVKKRVAAIRADFPSVKALHGLRDADYEFRVKGLYNRLRDTYERLVEECIFHDVVTRGADRIETLKLRYVHLPDDLALRFHVGMTKANTFSHDNPAAETVTTPDPAAFEADLAYLDALIADLAATSKDAETRRPAMKPKKI